METVPHAGDLAVVNAIVLLVRVQISFLVERHIRHCCFVPVIQVGEVSGSNKLLTLKSCSARKSLGLQLLSVVQVLPCSGKME